MYELDIAHLVFIFILQKLSACDEPGTIPGLESRICSRPADSLSALSSSGGAGQPSPLPLAADILDIYFRR